MLHLPRSCPRLGFLASLLFITMVLPLPSTASPARQSSANWTMYHANPARTGDIAGMPDPTRLSTLVPTTREGGIWSPPGPVIDAQGNLYVTVGNGAATQGPWDGSDSVLRFSPTLKLEDSFAPVSWASDNAADLDLDSMGPVLLPNGLLYANGKSGQGYLLRAHHLGGIGGQIATLPVCTPFGGAAVRGQELFIPCNNGLRQLTLAGSRLVTGWQAAPLVVGSPVIGGQTIYCLAPSGTLYAFDAATGRVRATLPVGITYEWATPALSGRSIYIGTWRGVVAVGIH